MSDVVVKLKQLFLCRGSVDRCIFRTEFNESLVYKNEQIWVMGK